VRKAVDLRQWRSALRLLFPGDTEQTEATRLKVHMWRYNAKVFLDMVPVDGSEARLA
jgi:hypothetical protein